MLRWHPECITDAQLIQSQSVTLTALNSRCWFKGFSFLCSRPAIKQISKCCSVQFSSVPQSCATLCDPVNHSTPGLPVHHQLPEFTQTHVHCLMMPSSHLILCHPLLLLPQSLPASGTFPMSQLFAWGGQSIGVSASASVLPMNTQDWSPLGWTG